MCIFSPSSAAYSSSFEGIGKRVAEIMAECLVCPDLFYKRK